MKQKAKHKKPLMLQWLLGCMHRNFEFYAMHAITYTFKYSDDCKCGPFFKYNIRYTMYGRR